MSLRVAVLLVATAAPACATNSNQTVYSWFFRQGTTSCRGIDDLEDGDPEVLYFERHPEVPDCFHVTESSVSGPYSSFSLHCNASDGTATFFEYNSTNCTGGVFGEGTNGAGWWLEEPQCEVYDYLHEGESYGGGYADNLGAALRYDDVPSTCRAFVDPNQTVYSWSYRENTTSCASIEDEDGFFEEDGRIFTLWFKRHPGISDCFLVTDAAGDEFNADDGLRSFSVGCAASDGLATFLEYPNQACEGPSDANGTMPASWWLEEPQCSAYPYFYDDGTHGWFAEILGSALTPEDVPRTCAAIFGVYSWSYLENTTSCDGFDVDDRSIVSLYFKRHAEVPDCFLVTDATGDEFNAADGLRSFSVHCAASDGSATFLEYPNQACEGPSDANGTMPASWWLEDPQCSAYPYFYDDGTHGWFAEILGMALMPDDIPSTCEDRVHQSSPMTSPSSAGPLSSSTRVDMPAPITTPAVEGTQTPQASSTAPPASSTEDVLSFSPRMRATLSLTILASVSAMM